MGPSPTPPVALDKSTKISLGLVAMLIPVLVYAGSYLSSLNTSMSEVRTSVTLMNASVSRLDNSLKEVKQALNRNTVEIGNSSKEGAVLRTLMESLQSQMAEVKRRVKELERRK
jgi:chromosome segregation ATPase